MLSLVTCTGGRPEAFALLEGWISRQTYKGELDWIVVDDCDPPTQTTCGQVVIRPRPRWAGTGQTLGRNITAALEKVRSDKIVFIEDDEAYLEGHLLTMDRMLDKAELVGGIPARYYNVRFRGYRNVGNKLHASLAQTGIRGALKDDLTFLAGITPFMDLGLWKRHTGVLEETDTVVSTKGLPGRPGIGAGHRAGFGWAADPTLSKLREWMGNYADLYAGFKAAG